MSPLKIVSINFLFLSLVTFSSAFAGELAIVYQCKTISPSKLDSVEILKKLGETSDGPYAHFSAITTFDSQSAITGAVTTLAGPFLSQPAVEVFPLEFRDSGFLLTINSVGGSQSNGFLTASFRECSGGCQDVPIHQLPVRCSKINTNP